MREERRRDRAQPRGEEDRVLATFERRELLLDRGDRRIPFARVEGIGRLSLRRPGERRRIGEGEGRRLEDRVDERASRRGSLASRVDGQGLRTKGPFLRHPRRWAPCSGRTDLRRSSLITILRSSRIPYNSAPNRRSP